LNKIKNFLAALMLAVSSVAWLPAVTVKAVAIDLTCTWDAEGVDNKFTTVANWDDETDCTKANMEDDAANNLKLVFPSSIADRDIIYDLANGTKVHSITFTGTTDYADYSIDGTNGIELLGNITSEYLSEHFFDIPVVVGANVSILSDAVNGYMIFSKAISGSGNIIALGIYVDDASTWTGSLTLNGGINIINVDSTKNGFGTTVAGTTISGTAELHIMTDQARTIAEPLTFTGTDDTAELFTLNLLESFDIVEDDASADPVVTFSGAITLSRSINVSGLKRDMKITGVLSGTGETIKPFSGTDTSIEVASSNNTSGTVNGIYKSQLKTTTIETDLNTIPGSALYNNKLVIKTPGKYGNISVSGGILGGNGTVKNITMSSGTVAPGLSPGCLASNNLAYTGGTVEIEIKGTTKCTDYDQQTVTGTVALGTNVTTLKVVKLTGYTAKVNDTFTIIDNDSTDAVTGAFKDLAEGATFTTDGVTYKITYKGGTDGNDVVLTVTALPGSPNTGTFKAQYTSAVVFGGLSIAAGVYLLGGKKFKLPRRRK
jgi:hypothetical protein